MIRCKYLWSYLHNCGIVSICFCYNAPYFSLLSMIFSSGSFYLSYLLFVLSLEQIIKKIEGNKHFIFLLNLETHSSDWMVYCRQNGLSDEKNLKWDILIHSHRSVDIFSKSFFNPSSLLHDWFHFDHTFVPSLLNAIN